MQGVFYLTMKEDIYGYVDVKGKKLTISKENSLNCLHGDLVKIDKNKNIITEIISHNDKQIIGVLQITSKVTLGFTRRKIPQKKFIPVDKNFPHFKVASKIKPNGRDLYGIVKIKGVNKNNKYPDATLERVIGPVGDYNAEIEYLKYRNCIKWKKIKNQNKDNPINITNIESSIFDFRLYHVFSIDPKGCKDIDDAFHVIEHDNIIEIGVHIADVSRVIKKNSELDNIVKKRGQSIYFPNEQINMLPDYLATNECSLIEDKDRFVFSTILKFNKFNNELVDYKFTKGIINNKKNFSYNEANRIINNDYTNWKGIKNPKLITFSSDKNNVYGFNFWKTMLDCIYNFGKELYDGENYDIHKMVEYFMVLTNKLVAEYLVERIPDKTILRIFNGTKLNNSNKNTDIKEAILMSKLLKYEKAKYVVGKNNNTGHGDLGLKYYTHFTSPIRRYSDILVHRLLKDVMDENDVYDYSSICEELNHSCKNIKIAEREMNRLEIIYKLYDFNDSILETHGYIVNIIDNQISVYIPDLKIESPCKVFSKKIKHIIDYDYDDSKIILKSNKGTVKLHLLKKVKIKIIISLLAQRFKDKIIIQLIEPNLSNFFIS